MYDELKNQGLSEKVIRIQRKYYAHSHFSQQSVRQISSQEAMIEREPYLLLSNKEYYILTSSLFLIITVIIGFLKSELHSRDDDLSSGQIIIYMTNVCSAIVQPIVVYTCSGYFYYQACAKFEIKTWKAKFALGFAYFGIFLAMFYAFIVIFNISVGLDLNTP
eukprot:403354782